MRQGTVGYFLTRVAAIAAIGITPSLSLAQDPLPSDQPAQRVEVTGSAIKRIAKEGALPVQTYTQEDIKKTGAQSAAEVIQMLPVMQGFIPQSNSVNGAGGGLITASIHDVGSNYTLVLVNGRRIARTNGNSIAAVNLGNIPVSAIDHIEVLTDGASALYGSDAIAGVVNFILKKNTEAGSVEATYSSPFKAGGGRSWNGSISKGFGDLEKDRYNVVLSYGHDEQNSLDASRRDYANSGVREFDADGKTYTLVQLSSNTAPAGVTIRHNDGTDPVQYSPNLVTGSKTCGPNTIKVGKYCKFDYASTVQLIPKSVRDSWAGSVNFKVNKNLTLFVDTLVTRFALKAKYAPPAQPLGLKTTDKLFTKYVVPTLPAGETVAKIQDATMNLRLVDAGGREDNYRTDAQHYVFGLEGNGFGWDYNAAYTYSVSKWADVAAGGYTSSDGLTAIMDKNGFDPFLPAGQSVAALAPAVLHQTLDHGYTSIDVFGLHGSHDLFKTPGGMSQVALGFETQTEKYVDNPSAILTSNTAATPSYTDAIIGGGAGTYPFSASRLNYGAFAEALVPIIKDLDATGSMRYDHYDQVRNTANFDAKGVPTGNAKQGKAAQDITYKLSARYQPTSMLLFRGSVGTGFRAPILTQIANPQQLFGVTSGTYPCPVKSSNCSGTAQYDLITGGNPLTGDGALKPESSAQATLGVRVEPLRGLSVGLDYWQIRIKNQISVLQESIAFANPGAYPTSFNANFYDPIQKSNAVAFIQTPINLATARYRGIDWDASYGVMTPAGNVGVNWTGTYMMQADQDYPVVGRQSSLGRYGADQTVVFNVITRLAVNLKVNEMWNHLLAMNYRSGYHDQEYVADDGAVKDSTGAYVDMNTHKVKSYSTYDWQSQITWKSLIGRVGIKNLLDQKPPLSIQNAGGGNQIGYDGRYADPLGRQYYLTAAYKF